MTPEKRSWNMSRIKSKDTTPERIVRSFLHRNGFRFRLHVKDLPGKPDIARGKGLRPGASYGRIDKYEVQLIRRRLSDEEDNGQCILCRCE